MPKIRRLISNYSKGELSPLIEGMPDLAAYFEGGSTMENWLVMRQGGMTRRPGLRFIKEVKNSALDTILLPFEFSVDDAYILEVGNQYFRVYRDREPVLDGPTHVEVATPYLTADLREIHFTQSADILWLFHVEYQQRKISRVSDTEWSIPVQTALPSPSFQADTTFSDILAIGSNSTGSREARNLNATFLNADVGRQIIIGAGRAIITSFVSTVAVVVDVIDAFNQTITAGPNTLSTVGTAATSTAHGLSVNDFVVLTSGAQSGQLRRVAAVGGVDTFTLDAAFGANQTNETWNKIIATDAGDWALRLSPQTTLDPNIKAPVGAQVTLVAGVAAFRSADIGKHIAIYGGIVKITAFDSTTQVRGTIMSELADAENADPSAAAAGTWTLEVVSWSASRGWPRTGEFLQGRLYQAATPSQPTTFWGSRSDDFDNYAIGVTAEDAVEYAMASRQINRIEWLSEKSKAIFIGTSGAEHSAVGSGDNQPLGGDIIPNIEKIASNGCMGVQPIQANKQTLLYLDRSRRRVMAMGWDLQSQNDADKELSVGSEHITESGVRLGPIAYQKRLNPRIYFVREDGTLVSMTFFPEQKIVAFTRLVTEGTFEAVACIPAGGVVSDTAHDEVWVIVKRTVDGQTKRYVELFDESNVHMVAAERPWTSLQTDSAIIISGITGTTVTGLDHLEGLTVDVVKNGSALPQAVVSGGTIVVQDDLVVEDFLEIGLHYDSTFESMRPAVEGQVIEGLPRSWDTLWVRLFASKGGKVQDQDLLYPPDALDTPALFTGDIQVKPNEVVSTDGRVRIVQDQPYPMTVLCHFGECSLGDVD